MHTNSFTETISTGLGVLFTTDLKFSRYINNIILKANRTLALLSIALILTYLGSCMTVLYDLNLTFCPLLGILTI